MSGFDFDKGKTARDRRLRRALLDALYHSRQSPRGGLHGRPLVDLVQATAPAGSGFEDDGHAVQLIRDLSNKGLVAEELLTRRRGETFGPEHLFVRITDKGSMLVREQVPADPDVDDDRIAEGN